MDMALGKTTKEKVMLVNGLKIWLMVMVFMSGKMETVIKGNGEIH